MCTKLGTEDSMLFRDNSPALQDLGVELRNRLWKDVFKPDSPSRLLYPVFSRKRNSFDCLSYRDLPATGIFYVSIVSSYFFFFNIFLMEVT